MRAFVRNPIAMGVLLVCLTLATFVVLFSKDKISVWLMSGDTISARFTQADKLRPDVSVVKVAYVQVGKVTGVDRQSDGSAVVTMKVDSSVLQHLGTQPSATIRPTTVLGGTYFVDLEPGGDPGAYASGSQIPEAQTHLPVELDKVARVFQPNALKGMQGGLSELDKTLASGGSAALDRLMATAPAALRPTAQTLQALEGTRPNQDLTDIVTGLQSTARALTTNSGQLARIADGASTLAATLGNNSGSVATTLDVMPGALSNATSGLTALSGSLDTLTSTAASLRPVAAQLGTTLDRLSPVLAQARPVVADLRSALANGTPVIQGLVPEAPVATQMLTDVKGPVINRVNGPIMSWLNSPSHGTGLYSTTQSSLPVYEDTVYALVNLDRASQRMDANGHAIGLQAGVNPASLVGIPGVPVDLGGVLDILTNYLTRAPGSSIPQISPLTTLSQILSSLKGGK